MSLPSSIHLRIYDGQAYCRIGYEFEWAQIEVFLFLNNRRGTLSVHSMQDFIEMEKTANFADKVALGDLERIMPKLRTCLRNAAILAWVIG